MLLGLKIDPGEVEKNVDEAREGKAALAKDRWAVESSQQLATALGTGSMKTLLTGDEERMEEAEGGLEEREIRPTEMAVDVPPFAVV